MSAPDLAGPGLLRTLHVFRSVDQKTLRMLRRECDLTCVKPGVVIQPPGRLHWAYGILTGAVTVITGAPLGPPMEPQLWFAESGDTIGLQEAVLGIQPAVSIQALVHTRLVVVPQRALVAAMETAPGLALSVARTLIAQYSRSAET